MMSSDRRGGERRGAWLAAMVGAALLLPALHVIDATPAAAVTPQREEFTALPPAPWTLTAPAGVSDGSLNIGVGGSAALGGPVADDLNGYIDNDLGWWVETRARVATGVHACSSGGASMIVWDRTATFTLGLGGDGACLLSPLSQLVRMDTQTDFHTYRLEVRRQNVRLLVDGVSVLSRTATAPGAPVTTTALTLTSPKQPVSWDYVAWDATPTLPACTIKGTGGADKLTGTSGNDVICAGGGNDVVDAGGGNDVVLGGAGDDKLSGGAGEDVLVGGFDRDTLIGGAGDDREYGGQAWDTFVADATPDGADFFAGGGGVDTVTYAARAGRVVATLDGTASSGAVGEGDTLGWGWPGALVDTEGVTGGSDGDTLTGGKQADRITGGPGADIISGAAGADFLDAKDSAAGDTVDGGADKDKCLLDRGDTATFCEP